VRINDQSITERISMISVSFRWRKNLAAIIAQSGMEINGKVMKAIPYKPILCFILTIDLFTTVKFRGGFFFPSAIRRLLLFKVFSCSQRLRKKNTSMPKLPPAQVVMMVSFIEKPKCRALTGANRNFTALVKKIIRVFQAMLMILSRRPNRRHRLTREQYILEQLTLRR